MLSTPVAEHEALTVAPAGPSRRNFLTLAGLTVLAIGLSLLAISPRVIFWKHYSEITFETARVESLLAQLHDPGGWDRAYLANPFFGDNALRWRLLPPVIGHALHLPPTIYLGLPWAGLFVLVGTCLHYLRLRHVSNLGLLAAGVLIGTSSAFFGSSTSLGYFDCLYLQALVVFTFSPSPLLAVGACLLGPWCDEKFLLMLPACGAMRWSQQPSWRWVGGCAVGVLIYCGARLAALAGGESSLALQLAMQSKVFFNYCYSLPLGWWYGFRLGWVFIAAGIGLVWLRLPQATANLMLIALLAAVAVISFLAWDTTRSVAMLLPFFLVGASEPSLQRGMIGLAAINPLLPAAYLCCADPVTVPLTSFLR